MPKKIHERKRPAGLMRLLLRAPIWLYRLGLGSLLGKRFLLINHVGRKSGKLRQAVVEVIGHDEQTGAYYISSGYGTQSQWYQNLLAEPQVTIMVGRKLLPVTAVHLSPAEAGDTLLDYARRHPTAINSLARVLGYELDGTEADYRALGEEGILPVIRFDPRPVGREGQTGEGGQERRPMA